MPSINREATGRKGSRRPPIIPVALLEHATFAFKLIPKKALTVPVDEYQRDESAGLIAKDIALHYNRVAFGALTVIERHNGGGPLLLVADGGTRLAAALLRDDVNELPCLVFSGLTKEEEADVFLAINQNRRKLRVEQLQHSEVFAGRPHALRVDEIMQALKDDRIDFSALAALRSCVKRFPGDTTTIVKLLRLCAVDKHVGVRVFKGLVYLESQMQKHERTLFERTRIAKLKNKFGVLDTTVNAALGSQNIRSSDPLICARAIAAAIGIKFPR